MVKSKYDIEKRLKQINMTLIHEGYVNGWELEGLRREKEELEQQLKDKVQNEKDC